MSPEKRPFLSSHPLAIALTVACILVLIGGFIVVQRSGRSASPEATSWTVNSGAFSTTDAEVSSSAEVGASDFTNVSTDILRFPIPNAITIAENAGATSSEKGFGSFIAGLLGGAIAAPAQAGGVSLETLEAYFYLPRGTVNATRATETPTEAALRAYGNGAGAIILGFEASHPDMMDILTAQAENREDEKNARALKELANDLAGIGTALEALENVPEEAAGAHTALAAAYQEVGAKLAVVAEIGSDETYLASIKAYNAAADTFTRRFIDLATIFSVSGVSFSSTEGGSAFVLPGGGGL